MTVYRKWDIVLVPFPFTDLSTAKNRPALIVSPDSYNRSGPDAIIAFITSQLDVSSRPGDHRIRFWKEAGLPKPSLLRMKLATIDQAIIVRKPGRLFSEERAALRETFKRFFL